MYKIMIIEDDEKLISLMKNRLKRYGYDIVTVEDYSNIKAEFIKENPHLILLDINLPNFDGFFWCREIRAISNIPIIFISARFSDMDQVMAIENGGDDYITKPFSFDLLLAKIKSIMRRTYGEYSKEGQSDILEVDGLYLYLNQNTIELEGNKIELSKKEFILLYTLCKSLDEIVPREVLLEELWDDIEFVDDNTLSVNVTRLRRRLEEINIRDAIETKRGQGYMLKKTWE